MEYERQNPFTIENQNCTYDSTLKSFKVVYTIRNISSFYVNSARVRAIILDSSNRAVTGNYVDIIDIPPG